MIFKICSIIQLVNIMKEVFGDLLIIHSQKKDGNMSKKYGGDADLNRRTFFSKMDLELERFLLMQPDNRDEVVELKEEIIKEKNLYYKMIKADAIVSKYPNIYLYLSFGDCIPFTIYDEKQHIFAFAHLGWRSTHLNLHQKLFLIFIKRYHSKIEDLMIHIGPCIKKESYLHQRPKQLEEKVWEPYVTQVKDDIYAIDLCSYVTDFFKKQGIKEAQIHVFPVDTGSDKLYFSNYRTNHGNEQPGRFLYGVGMQKKVIK